MANETKGSTPAAPNLYSQSEFPTFSPATGANAIKIHPVKPPPQIILKLPTQTLKPLRLS